MRDLGRQVRSVDEDEGGTDVLWADLERVESANLRALVRPPRRSDSDGPIICVIAAGIVDEMAKSDAAGEAEVAGQGQLPIELEAVLDSSVKDSGQQRFGASRPHRQFDDAGGGRKGIALRGDPNLHGCSREEPRIADEQATKVKSVDADVACRARAETADLVGAVKPDLLIADARAERIRCRGDGILTGALRRGGSRGASRCNDGQSSRRPAHGRLSCLPSPHGKAVFCRGTRLFDKSANRQREQDQRWGVEALASAMSRVLALIFALFATPALAQTPASLSVAPAAQALFERDWVLMNWALKFYDSDRD